MKKSIRTTIALAGLVGLATTVEAATIQATPKERTRISQNQPYSPKEKNTNYPIEQQAILVERDYISKPEEVKF